MNWLKYYKTLIWGKLLGKGNDYVVNKMREDGIEIGEGTHIFSNIAASEPYLVTIGKNCTISTEVVYLTHDASIGLYMGRDNFSDICGAITVGNNVFIGNRVTILYGVTIPDNTIVAAGSVVTKSFLEPGCIIGGNPARVIGRVDDYLNKNQDNFLCLNRLNGKQRKNSILQSGKLVKK